MAGTRGRHRPRVQWGVQDDRGARALLRPRRQEGDRRSPRQVGWRAQHRDGVQRRPLRPCDEPHRDRCVVYDELPRAGGQGAPRADRYRARRDHDDPRRHEHPGDRRCSAQGPASGPLGAQLADPDDHRVGDGDHDDLPGADGQAQRHCGAGPAAERVADRCGLLDAARRHRRRDQRLPADRGGRRTRRDPRVRGPTARVGRLHQRHAVGDRRRTLDDGHRRPSGEGLDLVRQRVRLRVPHGRPHRKGRRLRCEPAQLRPRHRGLLGIHAHRRCAQDVGAAVLQRTRVLPCRHRVPLPALRAHGGRSRTSSADGSDRGPV